MTHAVTSWPLEKFPFSWYSEANIQPTTMSDTRPPLWKQLFGAAIGGSLALALYGGYTVASPQIAKITGWLVMPQSRIETTSDEPVRIADTDLTEREVTRIAAHAQRIANDFSSRQLAAAPDEQMVGEPPAPVEVQPVEVDAVEQEIANAWGELDAAEPPAIAMPEVNAGDRLMQEAQYAGEKQFYGKTGELPDSGIGVWLAAFAAATFAAAYVIVRRRMQADAL